MRTSFPMRTWGGVLVFLAITAASSAGADDAPLAAARRLEQEGKYAEAEDAYRALAASDGSQAALGLARCQEAVGQREEAATTLSDAAKKHPDAASLPAELARLALARGDHAAAAALATAASKLDKDQIVAHWVEAESSCAAGKLDEANAGYQRLVELFQRRRDQGPRAACAGSVWRRRSLPAGIA